MAVMKVSECAACRSKQRTTMNFVHYRGRGWTPTRILPSALTCAQAKY